MLRLHNRGLIYFEAVREAGSVREAARQLGLTPSALTRQISQMEDELGLPLFDRLPEGMQLTAAGEIVSRHALTVLQDAAHVNERLAGLGGRSESRLSLMAVEGVMSDFMPVVLSRMAERCPGVSLEVESGVPASVVRSIEVGQRDMGIAFSLPAHPELREVASARVSLGAVVPHGHPLAVYPSVSFEQCAAYPLILPSMTVSLRSRLDPLLQDYKGNIRVVLESSSIELMNRMVLTGAGVTFQSPLAIGPRSGLVHVPLNDPGADTILGAYVRTSRWQPPALEAFGDILRQLFSEMEAGCFAF